MAAHTLKLGQPLMSNDLAHETRFPVPANLLERGLRRSISVPVPERSGVRHVILAHGPSEHAAADRRTTCSSCESVAHVIAGALDRAASEDELRRRALEDPLTGLANRVLLSSQLGRRAATRPPPR